MFDMDECRTGEDRSRNREVAVPIHLSSLGHILWVMPTQQVVFLQRLSSRYCSKAILIYRCYLNRVSSLSSFHSSHLKSSTMDAHLFLHHFITRRGWRREMSITNFGCLWYYSYSCTSSLIRLFLPLYHLICYDQITRRLPLDSKQKPRDE